ncbi:MAG: hypothetical protein RSD54_08435 [Ruthenibacterium sp.]
MGKKNDLFTTVMRGFDKEEVLLYLNELIELHAAESKELKMLKQQGDAAPLTQTDTAAETLCAGQEDLQIRVQHLKESGKKLMQYTQLCRKEIMRLRSENAQLKQAMAGGKTAVTTGAQKSKEEQEMQKMTEDARQESSRILSEAQEEAKAIALYAAEEREKTYALLNTQKAQLETELQQLLERTGACKTFLQQTDSALSTIYHQK